MKRLLAQGAEAKIYLENSKIIKNRIKKNYRISEIDKELRKLRTRAEARLLERANRNKVNVPKVLEIDEEKNVLELEFIDGEKIRDYLDNNRDSKIFSKIGEQIKRLHQANITHGDLTTSNMIFKGNKVFLIDFGLGNYSEKDEDKAVDLHVLKECLTSKHYSISEQCWREFLKTYKEKSILKRLKIVERRGKYRH